MASITQANASIVTPIFPSETTFFAGVDELSSVQALDIAAGSSLVTTLGINSTPILALNSVMQVESLNIYIQTSADTSDADIWKLYLIPVWLDFATESATVFSYNYFDVRDVGGLVQSRTMPASSAIVDTLMHMSHTTTSTLISGGGSEVSAVFPQKIPLCAPYVLFDIVVGANSVITIESLNIWGARRKV